MFNEKEKMFSEQEWEEFEKRFSAHGKKEECVFTGFHAFWASFFLASFLFMFLKLLGA